VKNSIFWGNDASVGGSAGTVNISYSLIEESSMPSHGSDQGNNIFGLNPDFYLGSNNYYSLNPTSPCINTGTSDTTGLNLPLLDLAGSSRIVNDTVDMGAYEFYTTLNHVELDIKVFLEGPYHSGLGYMLNWLNGWGYIPLSQSYNQQPWNYAGTENVAAIPSNEIIDWILLEIRATTGDASTAKSDSIVIRRALFITKDGNIVEIDGASVPVFQLDIAKNNFAVIWHRNHLGVISAFPLVLDNGVYTYDFTTGANQAYGGSLGHKEIGTGIWGMIGGDGDANRQIGNADKNDVWNIQAGNSGYYSGDFNMDGQVAQQDKNDIWVPNSGSGGQVPDGVSEGGYKTQVPE
ncbi:MAG: hypothetical protein K8R58_01780, partial [Bacteroidales bacterium]|nr:hypothetical protein [Bacteroidales bacterium]